MRIYNECCIFQRTAEFCLEDKGLGNIKKSGLNNEFSLCIQNMLMELEKNQENVTFTQILLQLNALFVFQYKIFGQIDKKLFKRVLEIDKRVGINVIKMGNLIISLFTVTLLFFFTEIIVTITQYCCKLNIF